jgi:hypothetical protein
MNGQKVRTHGLLPGDILLYRGENIVAKMIRFIDNSEVSHAGLYLGDSQVAEVSIDDNPGLIVNELSLEGSEWVTARRLNEPQEYEPIGTIASSYLAKGSRYAYEQLFLLAVILLSRKINLDSPVLRRIAEGVFDKANEFVVQMHDRAREPMICSEFVFRAYDEALPEEIDPFTLEIVSQGGQVPRKRFSPFRLRERIFGAAHEEVLPTVHPQSLLATTEIEERAFAAVTLELNEVSDVGLDILMREYLDEPPLIGVAAPVGYEPASETSEDDVRDSAARFAMSLSGAYSMNDSRGMPVFGTGSYDAAGVSEKLKAVAADFVTPGDLWRSPSLMTVGKISG